MSILVVSDCSPIRALHHLGLLNLAHKLYGQILIPPAVAEELLHPTNRCPSIVIAGLAGFEIRSAQAAPHDLGVPDDLDAGETQAIALAIEIQADLLLMDERKGTAAAKRVGLVTIGVLGILLEGKRKGLVPAVLPLIDQLVRDLRFFVTPAVRQRIAELGGES